MRSPDPIRSVLAVIIGLGLAIILLTSCSVRRIEQVRTLEANNLAEKYYHTVWDKENNQRGERARVRKEIRHYLKTIRRNEK